MLFKITKNDIFEDNPELLSIDLFEKCSSRDLKYVAFVYDYKSPFRQLKMEDRKRKSALEAGFRLDKEGRLDKNTRNIVNGNVRKVQAAIEKYKELQHDQDRENVAAIDSQIQQIVELAKKPKENVNELEKSIKLSKELPALERVKKELIEILDLRDMDTSQDSEEDDTVHESELSTLDRFNQKNG